MSDNLVGLATKDRRPNLHYDLVNPATGINYGCHKKGWRYSRDTMAQKIEDGRIIWPKSPKGRPRHKKFLSDLDSEFTGFSSLIECGNTNEGTEEVANIMGTPQFIFPKPRSLIQVLVEQATDSNSLVLDSFAGSGTTGHAVLAQNKLDNGNRRFILVEMEPDIARTITAERVRRVIQGYDKPDKAATKEHIEHTEDVGSLRSMRSLAANHVEGLGGGFRFCQLGETLFDENGKIRSTVRFADLARHVYFSETGEPLPRERVKKSPFLGACRGVGVYLLYNGILNDKSANGGNVLTRATLAQLPPFDGPKVVYCMGCLLGQARLQAEHIIVRQIPYEIKIS